VDFGGLGTVVWVFGSMTWRCALHATNTRASPRRSWLHMMVGALSAEGGGIISFQDVEFTSKAPSLFHNAEEPLSQMNCQQLCPYFMPQRSSSANGSYYDTLIHSCQLHKREFVLASKARDTKGSAYWDDTNVLARWSDPAAPTPPRPTV